MQLFRTARIVVPIVCVAATAFAAVQTSNAAQDGPPMPKPTHFHEMLKANEGVWDAKVSFFMAPGMPPAVSKGVETDKLACNGMWLLSDFDGEAMGMPFQGHGVLGYDPAKQKYVSVWVDSMTTSVQIGEGTASADGKTRTIERDGPDMMGKMTHFKEVEELKGSDARMFTITQKGPDGKEATMMTIEYTRRKAAK